MLEDPEMGGGFPCICGKIAICSKIRRLLPHQGTAQKQKESLEDLKIFLTEERLSLATKICIGKGELKTVFRIVLEEIPNGTEVIRDQLDGLKEDTSGDLSASIQVNIGNGKLYEHEKPGEQAILLKDLLSLRNRMRVGRSSAALTNLFKHPVIVTFILEKWGHIRLFFFVHLRLVERDLKTKLGCFFRKKVCTKLFPFSGCGFF